MLIGMYTNSSAIKKALSNVASETTSSPVVSQPTAALLPQATQNLANPPNVLAPVVNNKFSVFGTSGITQVTPPPFENFAKKYISAEPDILFVSEYVVDDKSAGVLLVWEKYLDSTHYEVFKKNIFKTDAKYERILFLDIQSLEEETINYIDYLKNTVGLDIDENKIIVILDTLVKEDRIYEYKIRASRVPKKFDEVDYDFILESKQLADQTVLSEENANNIFGVSAGIFGSPDLAWIIALLNESVAFFGVGPLNRSLSTGFKLETNENGELFILTAAASNILKIFNESVSLFGLRNTVDHLLTVCKGLYVWVKDAVLDSIDETTNLFSYDNFKTLIKGRHPSFNLILTITESENEEALEALSKLSIVIPVDTGTESFASIENISKIFKFINRLYISSSYAQEKSEEVKAILEKITSEEETDVDTVADASSGTTVSSITGIVGTGTQVTTQGSSATAAPSSAPASTTTSTTTSSSGLIKKV